MDLRARGKRRPLKQPRVKKGREHHTDLTSPLDAIDSGTPGEVKLSGEAMGALQHLYNTSPSIQAARQILMGQLLSSGIVVRRNGKSVDLKPIFSKHLEDQWVPFARRVIDNFLMYGFVVVSLEPEDPPAFANLLGRGQEVAALSNTNKMGTNSVGGYDYGSGDAHEARKRKRPIVDDAAAGAAVAAEALASGKNLVPFVPDLGTYDVSFLHVGEYGYRRQYRIFATTSQAAYRQDVNAEIFFKSEPDSAGNICSPIATVFQSASFVSALEELALQAEVVRARQMLVTQPVQRQQGNQNLDPANLFFDSESRAIQASAAADEDAQQAQSLALSAKLMAMVNRMQTAAQDQDARPPAVQQNHHVPPALPPTLFAAPEKHQVVPGVRPPEARSDLVDVIRVVNDHVAERTANLNTTHTRHTRALNPYAALTGGNGGSGLRDLRRQVLEQQHEPVRCALQPHTCAHRLNARSLAGSSCSTLRCSTWRSRSTRCSPRVTTPATATRPPATSSCCSPRRSPRRPRCRTCSSTGSLI